MVAPRNNGLPVQNNHPVETLVVPQSRLGDEPLVI